VIIAIDTLVHNFLHRTGILRDFDADHLYGPRCDAPLQLELPRQLSTVRAARHLAVLRRSRVQPCNGRRIDDRQSSEQTDCPARRDCAWR
jgi:hypothetical protein